MTAPVDRIEGIQKRIASVVGKVLMEEVQNLSQPAPRATMLKCDAEIMRASRAVADAYDALQQAKFAGLREAGARMALERAAKSLERVMRKHGRFP